MTLCVVGLNYHSAPLALRECVAFSPEQVQAALPRLCHELGLEEVLILSTCNRTEIYTVAASSEALLEWWARERGLPLETLKPHLYFHHELAAVKHLSRVASGLHSMVLGEPQVFGQVKAAYQWAVKANTLGKALHRACQHSFRVTKKIRTQTQIGAKPVSIAFTAVSLVRRIFSAPAECKVVLVGAGETIALVAQHLAALGVQRFHFVNRSIERAAALASRWQGEAFELHELESVLPEVDIFIAATDSPEVLLHAAALEQSRRAQRRKPLLLIDLAMPRNIDAAITHLSDCYLYCLDDLQALIGETIAQRRDAAQQAEAIIEVEAAVFAQQCHRVARASRIKGLYQQVHACRDRHLAEALQSLNQGMDAEAVVQRLAYRLSQQLAHQQLEIE